MVRIARPLWTGVHVVAGYDVHTHVGRRPTDVVALPSRHRHCRLAAAVMEQVHVRVPEMPIRDAVDDIVEARFAQANPGGCVEDAIGHRCGCTIGEHNAERQPERDEDQKAVEVGARQSQVPSVREAGFEVRRTHETLNVQNDANVSEEGEHKRQQYQNGHNGLVWLHVVVGGARTVVKVYIEGELHAGGQRADEPDEQQQNCGLAAIEERWYVLRGAQAHIILNGRELCRRMSKMDIHLSVNSHKNRPG